MQVPTQYWLLKSEPGTYSWADLVRDGQTCWDGVRNAQARNNLRAMKRGDRAFFYHSGDERAVVGVARVVRDHYPDPQDPEWSAVDVAPVEPLARPVALAAIKAEADLAEIALVRQSRLSVMPIAPAHFERIAALGADGGEKGRAAPRKGRSAKR